MKKREESKTTHNNRKDTEAIRKIKNQKTNFSKKKESKTKFFYFQNVMFRKTQVMISWVLSPEQLFFSNKKIELFDLFDSCL